MGAPKGNKNAAGPRNRNKPVGKPLGKPRAKTEAETLFNMNKSFVKEGQALYKKNPAAFKKNFHKEFGGNDADFKDFKKTFGIK